MKTKRFLIFRLPVILLALGLVVSASLTLAGCGDLNNEPARTPTDGNNNGNNSDSIELDLPPLEEATTSQPTYAGTVSNSNVVISSELSMPDALEAVTDSATGVTLSIANGVFSFTLPETPADAYAWNAIADTPRSVIFELFGEYIGAPSGYDYQGIGVTIVNSNGDTIAEENTTIKFSMVERFMWNIRNTGYWLSRQMQKGSVYGNSNSSKIVYVYASENVTLSRAAKVPAYPNDDTNWGEVNLALKSGWNLVQIDTSTTLADSILTKAVTVKIADKNVPWTLSGQVSPPYKMVRLTDIPHAQLEKGTNQNGNPKLGVLVMNTMPQTGAPTGVVAFVYQAVQKYGQDETVSANFGLYVLNEWPPTSLTSSWTGTGNYYVALIPFISNDGAPDVPKLESGKVYANSNTPVTVNFNDDVLPYESGSYGNGSMVLTLSYNDFIAHNFSSTQ